jgi:hypothetical protein
MATPMITRRGGYPVRGFVGQAEIGARLPSNRHAEFRTASIGPNHAMILPSDANPTPDQIFGKDNELTSRRIDGEIRLRLFVFPAA